MGSCLHQTRSLPKHLTNTYSSTVTNMRLEVSPRAKYLREEREWYENLNTSMIELDLKYKAYGVYYHSVELDVRDELTTGATERYRVLFEYFRGGEPPIPIKNIRDLDDTVRKARFLVRRGRWADWTMLEDMKEDATAQLEDLKQCLLSMHGYVAALQERNSTGRRAVADTRGVARFDAMGPVQRSKFLLWASQMREIRIAKSQHSIKSVCDIAELILGEEERMILEWPEVIPDPARGRTGGHAVGATTSTRRERGSGANGGLQGSVQFH